MTCTETVSGSRLISLRFTLFHVEICPGCRDQGPYIPKHGVFVHEENGSPRRLARKMSGMWQTMESRCGEMSDRR